MVENYGAFTIHLESLAITDSQALKKAEIGYIKRFQRYLLTVDVLSPLRRLSLSMQKENHDPVKSQICASNPVI